MIVARTLRGDSRKIKKEFHLRWRGILSLFSRRTVFSLSTVGASLNAPSIKRVSYFRNALAARHDDVTFSRAAIIIARANPIRKNR